MSDLENKKDELQRMGFLDVYRIYGERVTDAPVEFHLATGLAVLSSAINRNFVAEFKHGEIYPNLWLLLLGPSGISRKTTSIKIGGKFLVDTIHKLPDESSPEGLIQTLSKRGIGIFVLDEFGCFLSSLKRQYMAGCKDFFCTMFDCPDYYERRLKKQIIIVRNVYISVLTATTKTRYLTNITTDDLLSGFCARFLHVICENKVNWKPVSPEDETDKLLKKVLIDKITELSKIFREKKYYAIFDEETLKYYNTWLQDFERKVIEEKYVDEMSAFYSRLATYVIKIAMLLQIQEPNTLIPLTKGEFGNSVFVKLGALKNAIALVEGIFLPNARKIVDECIANALTNRSALILRKVAHYIYYHKIVAHSTVLRNIDGITAQDLWQATRTLEERGDIEVISANPRVYRWIGPKITSSVDTENGKLTDERKKLLQDWQKIRQKICEHTPECI